MNPPTDLPTAQDPFTAAYIAVLIALANNQRFNSLVKIGNVNNFADGRLVTLLSAVQAGNLPEVTLLQSNHVIHPQGSTSEVSDMMQLYPLVTVTDTMQVTTINQIKFAVAGAMRWADLENIALWNGRPYIRDVTITGGQDGAFGISLPTVEAGRGINRQSTVLNIQLSLYVDRDSLPR